MSGIIPAGTALMSFIERAAKDETFSVEKFEALLRLQMEVAANQAERSFNKNMSDAQNEMRAVVKDARNSHLNSRYATLAAMDGAIRPIYTRYGFAMRFGTKPASEPGLLCITCTVSHDDGHTETTSLEGPSAASGSQGGRTATTAIQAVGSTITYLKRYLTGMVWNLISADEQDDDGEATRRLGARLSPPPSRPPVVEPRPRQTAAGWLDEIALELAAAPDAEAVEAICERPRYKQMRGWLTNGALERLIELEVDAVARTTEAETTAPNDDGDGVYANPADDPFRQPATSRASIRPTFLPEVKEGAAP